MKFELWQDTDSYSLPAVPSENRWPILNDAHAQLLLRIESPSVENAKIIYERFAFEGNPDGLLTLNEPGDKFLLHSYPCSLKAGDRVTFLKPYVLRLDGHIAATYPEGVKAVILPGDIDLPNLVWLRLRSAHQTSGILNLHDRDASRHLKRDGLW